MIKIRPTKHHDLDVIYNHACQLATISGTKSPDFILTKTKLEHDLFNSKTNWYGLVAEKNKEIIGSCLYGFVNTNRPFNKTGCLFLDILFVDSEYRNLGIGRLLMKKLTKIAQEKKLSRIELWCMKSNILANEFYIKVGAKQVDLLNVYTINIE